MYFLYIINIQLRLLHVPLLVSCTDYVYLLHRRPDYEKAFISRPRIPRTPDSRPRTSTPPPLGRSVSPSRPTSKDEKPGNWGLCLNPICYSWNVSHNYCCSNFRIVTENLANRRQHQDNRPLNSSNARNTTQWLCITKQLCQLCYNEKTSQVPRQWSPYYYALFLKNERSSLLFTSSLRPHLPWDDCSFMIYRHCSCM